MGAQDVGDYAVEGVTASGVAQQFVTAPAAGELRLSDRREDDRRWLFSRSHVAVVQRALVAADAVAILASLSVALTLVDPVGRAGGQIAWSLGFAPALPLLFKLYGLYDGDRKRLSHSTVDDAPGVFHAVLIGTLGLWAYLKLVPTERLVFAQALLFLTLAVLGVLAARAVARHAAARVAAPERVLLLGEGELAGLVLRKIRARRRDELELVGYLSADVAAEKAPDPELPRLGGLEGLTTVCRTRGIDRVVIASSDLDGRLLADLIREANYAGVKVTLLPSVVDVLGPATELDDLEGVTVLAVNPVHLPRSSWLVKRAVDVTLALAGLLVALPLLPIVALAIKLDSAGPVLFSQERTGRGGRHFRLFKLRTMVQDAEAQAQKLEAQSRHAAWLLLDQDPRVTRVGRFLRSTSIDELPQLWNVLRGEMSLVGPRPMPPATDRHINGWGRRRLDLTPGITGLWQVLGRVSLSFEEMIALDYIYVTNWSVWGDIRLLVRTVCVVFSRRGAN